MHTLPKCRWIMDGWIFTAVAGHAYGTQAQAQAYPQPETKRMPLPRWLPHDLLPSPNSAASVVVPVTPSRAAPTPSAGRCGLKALPAPKSKRHMNLSDDTRESLLRVPGAPPVPARRPAPCLCINAFQTACVTVTGYGAVHRTDDPVNRQISQ
jgi:hypothetical protein